MIAMFICRSNCPEFVNLNHVKRPRFYKTRRIIALCTKLVKGNVKKINPFSVVISRFWLIRPLFPKPSVSLRAKGGGTSRHPHASLCPLVPTGPPLAPCGGPDYYIILFDLLSAGVEVFVYFSTPRWSPSRTSPFFCRGLNTARTDVCTPVLCNRYPLVTIVSN